MIPICKTFLFNTLMRFLQFCLKKTVKFKTEVPIAHQKESMTLNGLSLLTKLKLPFLHSKYFMKTTTMK